MISKQQIKDIHSLRLKKYRDQNNIFVAEGPKVVGELLTSFPCIYIGATESWIDDNIHLLHANVKYDVLTDDELNKASLLEAPQQVIGIFERKTALLPTHTDLQGELCLALDHVQDPGNMGTILRIASWFGIKDIVCSSDCADIYSPKVVQATMGALGRVNVASCGSLAKYISDIITVNHDIPVYGTFLDGGNIYQANLSSNGLIVMGNEGNGISSEVSRIINKRLYIPPFPAGTPSIESLNVGVATAIVCAEFRRRQSYA